MSEMSQMTPAAAERLDEYMRDVRAALRAATGVDAGEVERDVREHVEAALREVDGTVSRDRLDHVLRRLGSPGDWVPEEDVSHWRRALGTLQRGPEDWRLSYLTIATFGVGLLVMKWVGPLVLLLSFLLARAAVSLTAGRGEELGARRWFVYPSLLFAYFVAVVVLLAWPAAAAPGVFARVGLLHEISEYLGFSFVPPEDRHQHLLLVAGWGGLAQGLWLLLLGGIFRARAEWFRALFRPFAEGFRPRDARWIVGGGLGIAVAAAALLILARPSTAQAQSREPRAADYRIPAHRSVQMRPRRPERNRPHLGAPDEELRKPRPLRDSVAGRIRLRFRELAEQGGGIQVAVVRSGQVVWSGAFGPARLQGGRGGGAVPMSRHTRLRIYSLSKPMTAVAAGRLMERGVLDPGAPVQEYVPAFPEKSDTITVMQLLRHTSGIRHYRDREETRSTRHCKSVSEALEILAGDPLVHPPGERQTYSTWGYVLLSAAIEGVTGKSYTRSMKDVVFRPAGMENTAIDDPTAEVPGRASFYSVVGVAGRPGDSLPEYGDRENSHPEDGDRELVPAEPVDNTCKWGGGAWLSTAEDVARFLAAAMDGRLVSAETLRRLTGGSSRYEGMGLGAGGTAFARADLDSETALVVLSNATGESWGPRVRTAVDELFRELVLQPGGE